MPSRERKGTYNGATVSFHLSQLAVLFERLSLQDNWDFSDAEKGLRTKAPTKVYRVGPREAHQDIFTYELAIPSNLEGRLHEELEDPLYERIKISSREYTITITKNPSISKGRANTRALVTRIRKDGREDAKQRFHIHDLQGLQRYVQEVLQ